MYITASTYGGIDWHDSRTIHEQLRNNGSFNIGDEQVPEAFADDIAKDFPYVGEHPGKDSTGSRSKNLLPICSQVGGDRP